LREFGPDQRRAYFFFAGALFLLLGSQNLIGPATTSTFINSVAYEKIPVAQTWLPFIYIPILFFYNFMINTFRSRPVIVMSVMCLVYSAIYVVVAVDTLLVYDWEGHKEGVMAPSLAWIFWFATNTKNVLFPVMFWSIMNDVSAQTTSTGVQYSRIAYGALVFGGQAGGIVGSTVAGNNGSLGGTPMLVIEQAVVLLIVPFLVWRGLRILSTTGTSSVALASNDRSQGTAAPEPAGGAGSCDEGCRSVGKQLWLLVDGLWMILTHPVLLGIFWIAAAHLVPRVILDYQGTGVIQWKWPAKHGDHSPIAQHNKQLETSFLAYANLANSIGTMALSFLGLRAIVDKGGLAVGLIVCPLISLVSILVVCSFGREQTDARFWAVQIVLVFVNVVQYALNGPCREMLYVRCTKEVKYKAKSWADMYGNILQKTVAAQINLYVNTQKDLPSSIAEFNPAWTGTYCSVWVAVWVVIAVTLGLYHARLEKNDLTVGKDDVGKWPCLQDRPASDAQARSRISLQGHQESNEA
jgi:hypothetical protein